MSAKHAGFVAAWVLLCAAPASAQAHDPRPAIEATGAVTHDLARRVLVRSAGAWHHCEDAAATRRPRLRAAVRVAFAVNARGGATGVVLDHEKDIDAGLHQCVATVVGRLAFPPSPTPGRVVVRLRFDARCLVIDPGRAASSAHPPAPAPAHCEHGVFDGPP